VELPILEVELRWSSYFEGGAEVELVLLVLQIVFV